MALQLQKAVRSQIKLRIGLIGPSGSGKTYSALTLAKGLGGKTLLVDTESKRGLIYANEFDYFYHELTPPYTPERFIEVIGEAEKLGVQNIILDSISHEWFDLLKAHDSMPGNSYTNWGKITPRHDRFIDAIVRCNLHVLATMRGKDQYVIEEKNGKSVPKKLGVGAQQRDGFEYECHVAFIIDQETNVASTVKDNTHRFENRFQRLTVEDGAFLLQWANSGESHSAKPTAPTTAPTVKAPEPASKQEPEKPVAKGKKGKKDAKADPAPPPSEGESKDQLFSGSGELVPDGNLLDTLGKDLSATAQYHDPQALVRWANINKPKIDQLSEEERVLLRKAFTAAMETAKNGVAA